MPAARDTQRDRRRKRRRSSGSAAIHATLKAARLARLQRVVRQALQSHGFRKGAKPGARIVVTTSERVPPVLAVHALVDEERAWVAVTEPSYPEQAILAQSRGLLTGKCGWRVEGMVASLSCLLGVFVL